MLHSECFCLVLDVSEGAGEGGEGKVEGEVNKLLKFGSMMYSIMGERRTSWAHALNPPEVHVVLVCVTLSPGTGRAYQLTEL